MTIDRCQKLRKAIDRTLAEIDTVLACPVEDHDTYRAGIASVKQRLLAPAFLGGAPDAPVLSFPVVSVVLPTYNRSGPLGNAVASVQAQSFRNWELLIVDDGSTDGTAKAVDRFLADRRIKYFHRHHAGHAAARNYGLGRSAGPLIAYIDSDNLWYPHFLETAVAVFRACRDIDCVYGALVSHAHLPAPRTILFDAFDRERLLAGNFIDLNTLVHRRTLIEVCGMFDEKLDRLVDWDLLLRFTRHKPAYRIPVLAAQYRTLDDQRVTLTRPLGPNDVAIRRKWTPDRVGDQVAE